MLKNDLLLKALRREEVPRPPVWMMRQAGRYLPAYQQLRRQYDFFTRVQTPELACEITLQPVDEIGVDAAIIFSDILVVPQALGMEVRMEEGKGPVLPATIQTKKDVDALRVAEAAENLSYVYAALQLTRRTLNGRVPLIGFAGAPFTLLCYMVEGRGSKTFDYAKAFCFSQPGLAAALLQQITEVTIAYLIRQLQSGADVVQVFDSWSGLLSPEDFSVFAEPYLLQIAEAVSPHGPVILFPKGSRDALPALARCPFVSGIGIDWNVAPAAARAATGGHVTLQGNFDPAKLMLPPAEIKKEAQRMIRNFGVKSYIANLGHGITPHVPVAHAHAFVEAVKEYRETETR
jgi:uroporphyrinogen decarboxylase